MASLPPNAEPARADLTELRDPLLHRLLPGDVRRAQGQAHRLPARLQVLLHEPRVVRRNPRFYHVQFTCSYTYWLIICIINHCNQSQSLVFSFSMISSPVVHVVTWACGIILSFSLPLSTRALSKEWPFLGVGQFQLCISLGVTPIIMNHLGNARS